MEYDPAISTHKASSITSTTSTNSSSSWDHPISSYIPSNSDLKADERIEEPISNLEDYHFDSSLISDRITVPPFKYTNNHHTLEYADAKKKFDHFLDKFIEESAIGAEALPELIPPPEATNYVISQQDDSSICNKKEYHEKDGSNSETCFHKGIRSDQLNDMAHENIFSPSSTIVEAPTPIYLQHGDQITVPSISLVNNRQRKASPSTTISDQRFHQQTSSLPRNDSSATFVRLIRPLPTSSSLSSAETTTTTIDNNCRQRSNSISSITSSSKRSRLSRDLLTDDEKRVNHIASEQKRRNTIRSGFKDLTDIIPTLKNINNSKSTILFKAVEYIKHLDKRNRGLQEKVSALKVRMNVEGRVMEQQQQRYHRVSSLSSSNTQRYHNVFGKRNNSSISHDYYSPQQPQQHLYQHRLSAPTASSSSTYESIAEQNEFGHLPPSAVSALMAHKSQQRQLEELQEQLRVQQQLLARHNLLPESTTTPSPPKLSSTTSFTQGLFSTATPSKQSKPIQKFQQLQQRENYQYNSISIPSSRSSNSDENEQKLQEEACSNHSKKRRPWQLNDA